MLSEEQLAKDLQKVEDDAAEKLDREFKAGVRKTISETDWSDIERRLATQQEPSDVADSVTWQGYDPKAVLEESIFPAASEVLAEYIADVAAKGSSLSFTVTDPNALKWLQEYGAQEIKYISDSQRKAIKEIVERGYRDGITYQQQAREIREYIGLDPRRAETLRKYSENLYAKGKSEAEVWRLMETKGKALLNARARNIAVQEATTAGARAFYETTADACKRGILDPNIYEGYRIVTGDERLCDRCASSAGEARKLPDGSYPSTGSVTPKRHMLCRCVEGIRDMRKKEGKPRLKESGKTTTEVVFEAKALKRKDGIIYCPTVPLVEGVFDGLGFPVLRLYEEFSKDAHWLNGLTVLTNHEGLNPNARRIGQLSDSQARPDRKDVAATTLFYGIDLTQREIEAITSKQPIHGSLGLSYNLEEASGTWNGKPYVAIERGPYVFYEYSMVRQGVVTPEDGAGFNMECRGCKNPNHNHAPGGADMEEERVQEMIEEAMKPLAEKNAALEQKNTALESEVKTLKESLASDKSARVFEQFESRLKPGHQEKAKEYFEASQKDPLWITENADKFIQKGQERRLQGQASTEGGDVPGVSRPYTTEEMNAEQQKIQKKVG